MMKTALILAAAGLTGLQALAADVDWSQLPPPATNQNLTFTNDILPIFKVSCLRCHGEMRPRAQLRLDSLAGVLKGSKDGSILTAGDSAHSQLVKAISQLDPKSAMPPKRRMPMRPMGPGGPGGPPPGGAMQPPPGGLQGAGQAPGGMQPPPGGPEAGPGPGPGPGPQGTNPPPMMPRNFGPPPKPLTPEQVGLVRAWIDQGAK